MYGMSARQTASSLNRTDEKMNSTKQNSSSYIKESLNEEVTKFDICIPTHVIDLNGQETKG